MWQRNKWIRRADASKSCTSSVISLMLITICKSMITIHELRDEKSSGCIGLPNSRKRSTVSSRTSPHIWSFFLITRVGHCHVAGTGTHPTPLHSNTPMLSSRMVIFSTSFRVALLGGAASDAPCLSIHPASQPYARPRGRRSPLPRQSPSSGNICWAKLQLTTRQQQQLKWKEKKKKRTRKPQKVKRRLAHSFDEKQRKKKKTERDLRCLKTFLIHIWQLHCDELKHEEQRTETLRCTRTSFRSKAFSSSSFRVEFQRQLTVNFKVF